MKILAFAASNSKNSINKQLVTHAAEVLGEEIKSDVNVEYLDLNDFEMPIYSQDREASSGIHELAQTFFDKIGNADALLVSFAEHNGHYSAAFKNIFDWASRIGMKVYQDKPMVVMSASAGPGGGANVLKAVQESAPFFGANILGGFSVGPFSEKFDADKNVLVDSELANTMRQSLQKLA